MNPTDTRTAPRPTERWAPYRVFGIALAVALGILTALVVAVALLALVFAPSDRVDLVDVSVDEETVPFDAP